MAVRLRLARHHLTRNNPCYSLVATRAALRPTAKPLEVLGTYEPIPTPTSTPSLSPNGQLRDPTEWGPSQATSSQKTNEFRSEKRIVWNLDRVKYWLGQGAKPTKTVEKLLVKAGILDLQVIPQPSQGRTLSKERRVRDAVRKAGLVPSQQQQQQGAQATKTANEASAKQQPSASA